MLRERRRVKDPGVREDSLKGAKIFVAQLAPPKVAQRLEPEKCEPHFLLEIGLERRRHRKLAATRGLHQRADAGKIREIKQLEESVSIAPRPRLVIFCGHNLPGALRKARVQLPGEPFHLRPIGGRFLRDENVAALRQDGGEAVEHSIRATDHVGTETGVGLIQPAG